MEQDLESDVPGFKFGLSCDFELSTLPITPQLTHLLGGNNDSKELSTEFVARN